MRSKRLMVQITVSVVIVSAVIAAGVLLSRNIKPADGTAVLEISAPPAETAPDAKTDTEKNGELDSKAGTAADTAASEAEAAAETFEAQGTPEYIPDEISPYETAAEYISSMTLHEKICQMLVVTPDCLTGVSGAAAEGRIQDSLIKYPVGGLIYFTKDITSAGQITRQNQTAQQYSKTPLLISTDEEGGRVARLKSAIGAHSVGPMLGYEKDGAETAYNNAFKIAGVLAAHGFNTNLAPVADVWSNPQNTVIGDRAYSGDFLAAAELVTAAVRGFGEGGVACALKHFPGHGDTRGDSHNGAVYVDKTLDELRECELVPFMAGITAGADMVMVGHLIVPDADILPAALSKTLITDVLRGEMGFAGVIITDSLEMGAITGNYSVEFTAVTAVNAGVDILLMPPGLEETISALTAAVENGDIPVSRIDESAARIIAMKIIRGIITPE